MTAPDSRLLALEEKVAYQDKLIAELNQVVVQLNLSASSLEGAVAVCRLQGPPAVAP